jgi:hypothetical protein
MKILKLVATTAACVAPMVVSVSASAAVLVGNLGRPSETNCRLGPVYTDNIGLATAFRTGSLGWSVANIQAYMGNASGTISITAGLYKEAGSGGFLPDSTLLVGSFQVPPFGTAMEAATFLPTASVTLEANTTYYFALTSTSGSVAWDWTSTMTFDGVGTIPASGTSYYTDEFTPWTNADGMPQLFQVNGEIIPVPEPSSLALVAVGGLFLALRRRES